MNMSNWDSGKHHGPLKSSFCQRAATSSIG